MNSKNPFTDHLSGLIEPPVELDPSVLGRIFGVPITPPTPFGIPLNSFARLMTETPPTLGLGLLGAFDTPSLTTGNLFRDWAAQERCRRRREWNDRFRHWEKPPSTTEETTLNRAHRMVRDALSDSVWLGQMGGTLERQGSHFNNTNTRRDSDVDLRLEVPIVKVEYNANVTAGPLHHANNYNDTGWTEAQLCPMMRWELDTCLKGAFGETSVVPGKKAYRVKALPGSRGEIDVVPAMPFHHVFWSESRGRFERFDGVAILSTDGLWTYNFPRQHRANGVAKRNRTNYQFKRVVRIFKRLRGNLISAGWSGGKVPSFLVECLVYLVEDGFFAVPGDDRYDRVRRVAHRLQAILRGSATTLFEINEIKPLFGPGQAWTYAQACYFADALVGLLGDA